MDLWRSSGYHPSNEYEDLLADQFYHLLNSYKPGPGQGKVHRSWVNRWVYDWGDQSQMAEDLNEAHPCPNLNDFWPGGRKYPWDEELAIRWKEDQESKGNKVRLDSPPLLRHSTDNYPYRKSIGG